MKLRLESDNWDYGTIGDIVEIDKGFHKELYEDINNNLNDWLNWGYADDEEELKEYREKLILKLNTLGIELAKREK